MAKITYSALITDISGTIGGSTLKRTKGRSIILNKVQPAQRRTARQHNIRGYINDLSSRWAGLATTRKELWNNFASLSPKKQSGINAFIMLNQRLLSADHASLVLDIDPPVSPSTPESVKDFDRNYISGSKNRLTWTAPNTAGTYTQVYYCVEPGYSFDNKEKWNLVETIISTCLQLDHDHDYPSGTVIRYHARSIDTNGRISPRTNKI